MFRRILRLGNSEIALGFILATVFWIGILGWQAAHAPSETEKRQCQEAAHKADHKSEECKTLWERTTSDPVAFFTFWLVISTIGLGASTVMLWRAGEKQFRLARRSSAIQSRDMQASIAASNRTASMAARAAEAAHTSNKIAQETAERQLRAYIVPEKVTATVMKIGLSPEVQVQLRNSGQTPAYRVMINTLIGIRPATTPASELDWNIPMSRATVAPNMEIFILGGGSRLLKPLTQTDVDAIKDGRSIFYVYGEVRYADAFGNNRTTKYSYVFRRTYRRSSRRSADGCRRW
jgi:hypothetical protein